MVDQNWWQPENLTKSEKTVSKLTKFEDLDTKGDFGSYKLMLEKGNVKESQIKAHNDINPAYRVKSVKRFLGNYQPSKILDVGCGLGYTTRELKNTFPNASIWGVDISSDGIKYAKKHFKDCHFEVKAVDPNVDNLGKGFDLICAFEFYPFTRTKKVDVHRKYLNLLLDSLTGNANFFV